MNQIFYFQKENLYIEFISSTITISCVIIIMYLSFCVIPHRESGPFLQNTREFNNYSWRWFCAVAEPVCGGDGYDWLIFYLWKNKFCMKLSEPQRILKNPKGNPYYSIRTEQLPQEGVTILMKMKELNPDGKLLFMHEGRPLITDSFNRRLKKYCTEIGIPYLSSHKKTRPNGKNIGVSPIFTGCTTLYNFFRKIKSASSPLFIRVWDTSHQCRRPESNRYGSISPAGF